MRQAWHIFRKDVRGMRAEVALLVGLAVALGWAETRLFEPGWVELIAMLAVNYAIARVIHNEAIPGYNQFWVTRPYRWKSLLLAKVIFILLCIQAPMLLAQIYMIVAGGFPFGESLPGLVWSQVLMLFCAVVPAVCVASLTSGLVTFLFSELVVGMLLVGVELLRSRKIILLPAMQAGPDAMDWVRSSLVALVIAVFAALVLFRQYRNRETSANRVLAAGGIVIAGAVFLLMPWSIALGVQTGLAKQNVEGSRLEASLESVRKTVFPIRGSQIGPDEVNLPIAVKGLPAGMEAVADAFFAKLTAGDGQQWSADFVPTQMRGGDPGVTLLNVELAVDPDFFEKESSRPVTLHAEVYFTLFGNAKSQEIPLEQTPVNVMDGLQCSEGVFIQFNCRSIFRWPRRRVSAAAGSGPSGLPVSSISYSPFPAELGFGSVERHSFSVPYKAAIVTITTREPVSHFRAEVTIRDIRLSGYTKEASRKCYLCPDGTTGTD